MMLRFSHCVFRLVLLYAPTMHYMSDWFVERRGLALGIIDAGK